MIHFSILCTNARNGGQHELLIEAESQYDAEQHVLLTRPHYIVKRVDVVEKKYVCIGWNIRHDRYDELAYLATSAEVARARCQELHPDFAIDRVEQEM
jgi:hypothetical protein